MVKKTSNNTESARNLADPSLAPLRWADRCKRALLLVAMHAGSDIGCNCFRPAVHADCAALEKLCARHSSFFNGAHLECVPLPDEHNRVACTGFPVSDRTQIDLLLWSNYHITPYSRRLLDIRPSERPTVQMTR